MLDMTSQVVVNREYLKMLIGEFENLPFKRKEWLRADWGVIGYELPITGDVFYDPNNDDLIIKKDNVGYYVKITENGMGYEGKVSAWYLKECIYIGVL